MTSNKEARRSIAPKTPTQKRRSAISAKLLRWFDRHRRDLPWRRPLGADGRRDPYRVWLAEVMLQQTQVNTVLPYYDRWLKRFPTLHAVAAAPLDDVLKLWEGLGYYARARHFHHAAQIIAREYNGRIPDTVEALRTLPGVGRYTAGAIASLAFGRDVPALDGNARRVLSRLFALSSKAGQSDQALWQLSLRLLPAGRAGDFNEALMDLGASICLPRAPRCETCPLSAECAAYAKGQPAAYPTKIARPPRPHYTYVTAIILDPMHRLLLAQRPPRGLLGGLWEFPTSQTEPAPVPQLAAALQHSLHTLTGLRLNIHPADFVGSVRHAYTHFRMTRHVAVVRLEIGDWRFMSAGLENKERYTTLRWVTADEADRLALTRSDRKILQLAQSASRMQS